MEIPWKSIADAGRKTSACERFLGFIFRAERGNQEEGGRRRAPATCRNSTGESSSNKRACPRVGKAGFGFQGLVQRNARPLQPPSPLSSTFP